MIPPDSFEPSSAENGVEFTKGGGVIHSPFLPIESFRRGPVPWGLPASWWDWGNGFRSGPFSSAVVGILENIQP